MRELRRGTTLVEVSLALCLLAVAVVATAQILTLCARQRKAADRQFAAQMEASNVAERIAATEYDDLTAVSLAAMKLSPETQSALAGGELAIACTDVADSSLRQKRITIEVAWPTAQDGRRSVHLTTWKFGPPDESP
jgi:Tfp pilus assembly protein PilV